MMAHNQQNEPKRGCSYELSIPDRHQKMFCKLPTSVFCSVFSDWVSIKDIGRLDSAYCNVKSRPAHLQSLLSKEFVFKNSVDVSNKKLLLWLLARKMKSSDVNFGISTGTSLHVQPLADFLRHFGDSVRIVRFQAAQSTQLPQFHAISAAQTAHTMHLVAIHCRRIKVMSCVSMCLEPALREVLWCNPHLEELRLVRIPNYGTQIFDDVSLQSLKVLSATDCAAKITAGLWRTTLFSDSLEKLQLNSIDDTDLLALLTSCTGLKSLSLATVKLPDSMVEQVASLRPRLLHLDLSGNVAVTDAGVQRLVSSLQSLRSISIKGCTGLTDVGIAHLAEHCGNTLEVLHTEIRNQTAVWERFANKFTALKVLVITCKDKVMCLQGATFALLQGCPQLCKMVVDTEESICVTSRKFIELYRPDLTIEVYNTTHAYNVISMRI